MRRNTVVVPVTDQDIINIEFSNNAKPTHSVLIHCTMLNRQQSPTGIFLATLS